MTWEEIIKLRQGPLREKDAERLRLRTSPDKKDRDKADNVGMKERKELAKEIERTAISIASLFAREKMRITGADGRESKRSYQLLAKLMEQIAELYSRIYGDVDRVDNQGQSIASSNIQGDEYMRRTASKFTEVAQALRKK